MTGIRATFVRELRSYFFSPLAYVVLTLLMLINGVVFTLIVSFLNDPRAPAEVAPLEIFFGQTIFFWLVLMFLAPVLTMRLLSEERRSGTIEVLMTAPVTEGQIVAGKFLAALVFYTFLWLPVLAYAGVIASYGEIDWGPVASGYVGAIGIGALFLSIGTFASSLSRNQLVAAIFTFTLLIPLFIFGLLESLVNQEALKQLFGYLNLWQHAEELAKGIVDTRHLVYYISASVFFLFLAARSLEARKWR